MNTFFFRHWLFGEKVIPEQNGNTNRKIRIRGWFPRKCAAEMYENDSEDSDSSPKTVQIQNHNKKKYDVNSNGNAKKIK